jgi:hypothetical protein
LLAEDDTESPDAGRDPIALLGRNATARLRSDAPAVLEAGKHASPGVEWLPSTQAAVVHGWAQARWVASLPPEPPAEIDE